MHGFEVCILNLILDYFDLHRVTILRFFWVFRKFFVIKLVFVVLGRYCDVRHLVQENCVATDVKLSHGTLPILYLKHVGGAH